LLATVDTPMERLCSSLQLEVKFSKSPKGCGCRRFAAGLPLKRSDRVLTSIGNFAGMGLQTRVDSMDVYSTVLESLQGPQLSNQKPQSSPSSRMCHTITDLGESGSLLVGGRTAPNSAFKDCWLFHKCEFP
jgi:tRNA wybutosine-synthesizing protein 4